MQWFLGVFLKSLFEWLYDRIIGWIKARQEMKKEHDENVRQAEKDAEKLDKLNETSTKKDRDEATDDVLSRF